MLVNIEGDNVTHTLEEALVKVRIFGKEEDSRNGKVLSVQYPAIITIDRPWERVMFDARRNANPFFHLAEFVWMMSGSNDVRFIEVFNKRMRLYADDSSDIHHGAYGHRWRNHFGRDQIVRVSEMLHADPTSRRAVLGMWDPSVDLEHHNDLPCNTHIYFRVINGALNMTVCNRSNDLLWGCLGANAVHMTLLHELIARSAGFRQGRYQVFTNNLHVYTERSDSERMFKALPLRDDYCRPPYLRTVPVLEKGETLQQFLDECTAYVFDGRQDLRCGWLAKTFLPAMRNFQAQKLVADIEAPDWSTACNDWMARKTSAT